ARGEAGQREDHLTGQGGEEVLEGDDQAGARTTQGLHDGDRPPGDAGQVGRSAHTRLSQTGPTGPVTESSSTCRNRTNPTTVVLNRCTERGARPHRDRPPVA